MHITATVHKCAICLDPFDNFQEAVNCEMHGLPVGPRYPKGSIITYEDESTMTGTLWSYSPASGEVLLSLAQFNAAVRKHYWIYIVRRTGLISGEAVLVPAQNGYVSTAESKFNHGYAEALKMDRMQYAHLMAYSLDF